MRADEIRSRFLQYFARNGHEIRPSSTLVPADDPTLLFTNAGMVPFKRDAIRFGWEFLTVELGIPAERLWITVHYTDDEAEALWQEIAGLPKTRIFRLGDRDNFWQMADTGPCGPCSEIHFDTRPEGVRGTELTQEEFEELGERGELLELWNLVFMQYDRDADGVLTPLPAPSIDTGAGLERIASVMQGVPSNYGTDLFTPLIERAVSVVGVPYEYGTTTGSSYHVLADHARATVFLLTDGVFPSNEGRGYVLRRILRRAVRHAWLLGRREPTLVEVADEVITRMSGTYPELGERRDYILRNVRAEEERFLATIGGGMRRFDEIAPVGGSGTVSGGDVFRLYDTFGFPLDLTELMARERGYEVDVDGFEEELEAQRRRSREDRAASGIGVGGDAFAMGWEEAEGSAGAEQEFAAYRAVELETDVLAFRRMDDGRVALQLRENPFYAESGGQVADAGHVYGDGWTLAVDEVRKVAGRIAVVGAADGDFRPGRVTARVEEPSRRDTERNHTATHLLHAALRLTLGEHVHQQGSLVSPERLRFDFAHSGPMTPVELGEVEAIVNRAIWANTEVAAREMGYREAVDQGAMALFSEKYGDVVRVVQIPGVSMELCGGTHVRTTGQIGLFRIVSESGVAAGVRRIEAVTGPAAFERMRRDERTLREAASLLRTREENLLPRLQAVLDENRDLQRSLQKARSSAGGDVLDAALQRAVDVEGFRVVSFTPNGIESIDELKALGDRLRERLKSGVGVLATTTGKPTLVAVVTDDLVKRGIRADAVVREVAATVGGKGGGKPHLAQASIVEVERTAEALARVPGIVRGIAAGVPA